MKNDCDSPAIGMIVNLVRAVRTVKTESVSDQGGNDFASGNIPKRSVVNPHESDRDCHTRIDSHLDFANRFFWKELAVFKHALDNHVDHVVDVLKSFDLCGGPGGRSLPLKRRAIGMPAGRVTIEILVGLQDDFEIIGLHTITITGA